MIGVVTAGADGVYVCTDGYAHHLSVDKVTAIDTTGAGDATLAGMLANLSTAHIDDHQHLKTALAAGARMGTETVLFQGAGPWLIK